MEIAAQNLICYCASRTTESAGEAHVKNGNVRFPTFETVLYDEPRPAIARVTLNRPDKRNAQNMQMTYDINARSTTRCASHTSR